MRTGTSLPREVDRSTCQRVGHPAPAIGGANNKAGDGLHASIVLVLVPSGPHDSRGQIVGTPRFDRAPSDGLVAEIGQKAAPTGSSAGRCERMQYATTVKVTTVQFRRSFIRLALLVSLSTAVLASSPSGMLARSRSVTHLASVRFAAESVKVGDLFGLGTYMAGRYEGRAVQAVARIRQTGTDWVREEFTANQLHSNWNRRYRFNRYDPVVRREVAAHIHILGLLDYNDTFNHRNHAWMGHKDIVHLTDSFIRFVTAVVSHYRRQIFDWQIWNEPNISSRWEPAPNASDYAYLLKRSYLAIKKINPHATVLMAGPTTGNNSNAIGFVKKVAADHTLFDVTALQPYTPWPGPSVESQAQALLKLGKPVWFTEVGWPGQRGCVPCGDPQAQAEDVTTTSLSAAVAGVQRLFWYQLRDTGIKSVFWDHFGIVEHNFAPKPAFWAYKTCHYLLNWATLTGSVQPLPWVWLYRFRNHRTTFSVIWNTSSFGRQLNLRWPHQLANIDTETGRHLYATYGHRLQLYVAPYSAYYVIPTGMKLK